MHLKPFLLLIVIILTNNVCHSGNVTATNDGYTFQENFAWQGNHAATILEGQATTVWWDESSWDVRGDTAFISVEAIDSTITNRFHIDIHKALSSKPTNGTLSNTQAIIGGDGQAGVAVMHLDYQDILSARLRNPLLISNDTPALIDFYAPAFVTTGHWWEIALTPTNEVISGEHTSVPGQFDNGLPGPLGGDLQPGPGHDSPMNSINLVSLGATDVPCTTGWYTRFGLTQTVNNSTSHYINQVPSLSDLTLTDPSQADNLEHWRIQLSPNQISLAIDVDDSNQFKIIETWDIAIAWQEVFVHFLAVAYQADHHPQAPCFLGHIRELKWRNIKVSPVKYIATDVYPKNNGIIQTGRNEGWLGYDIRDIQRFGAPINGAPQPNLNQFSTNNTGLYCNDMGFPCFGSQTPVNLSPLVPEPPMGMRLTDAKLIADLKNSFSTPELPTSATIGNQLIGLFTVAESSPSVEESAWVRRSLDIPNSLIKSGLNQSLNFNLGLNAYLDRIEIELYYQPDSIQTDSIFNNGFEK